jgi:hypothetical protein
VPELEEEPREAAAYGSPSALYQGVEGVSQESRKRASRAIQHLGPHERL